MGDTRAPGRTKYSQKYPKTLKTPIDNVTLIVYNTIKGGHHEQ